MPYTLPSDSHIRSDLLIMKNKTFDLALIANIEMKERFKNDQKLRDQKPIKNDI